MKDKTNSSHSVYWQSTLSLTAKLLLIWFFVSFGCGIIFKDDLDQFSIGEAPFGFWMAQQGSILCFVLSVDHLFVPDE